MTDELKQEGRKEGFDEAIRQRLVMSMLTRLAERDTFGTKALGMQHMTICIRTAMPPLLLRMVILPLTFS
jgi:hypothetical protein